MAAVSSKWKGVFGTVRPAVIGMIHLHALPGTYNSLSAPLYCALLHAGTPWSRLSVSELVGRAVNEAFLYKDCGLDALMIENTHDTPYVRGGVGSEVTAVMARVATEIRHAVPVLPLGVQVLAGNSVQ